MSSALIALIFLVSWSSSGLVMGSLWSMRGWPTRRNQTVAGVSIVVFGAVLVFRPASLLLSNLAVLLLAVGVASLLGRSLRRLGALITFAVTVAIVDLFSFGGGLTRHIITAYQTGASDLLRFLAIVVPAGDTARPLVGVGDLFILGALFVGLTQVHGNGVRAGMVLLVGLTLALTVGLFVGGVAGLPFLAGAAALDGWWFTRTTSQQGSAAPDPQRVARR